jgi:hypothetical protein
MASNFNITQNRGRRGVHLQLSGDFDGSSALELIRILKNHVGQTPSVFIHTNGISEVLPFGCDVFQRRCTPFKRRRTALIFRGKHADAIAPRDRT